MRCVRCGGTTKVTDSRDDRNERNDWLLRAGVRVFGWWTSDFRLRKRLCLDEDCAHKETTIEITLADLEDSFIDLRGQLTIHPQDLTEAGIQHLDADELDSLAANLKHGLPTGEVALTRRTVVALVQEVMYRRKRQMEAQ